MNELDAKSPAEKTGAATLKSPPDQVSPDEKLGELLLLAGDPSTSPDLLAILSMRSSDELCGKIAANPNTPEAVLNRLWLRHPLAALENPILSYRTLATAKSLSELLPLGVKLALYGALRGGGRLKELESNLPEAERCGWRSYHLEKADLGGCNALRESIYHHLSTDPSPKVRRAMVDALPIPFFQLLAGDSESEIRIALASRVARFRYSSWEKTPYDGCWDQVVEKLSEDRNHKVRETISESELLTPGAHERLAKDSRHSVREKLARNGGGINLGEAGWRTLAEAGEDLCLLVAANRFCHESVRLDLTSHSSSAVRMLAWENCKFGRDALQEMIDDKLDELLSDPSRLEERVVLAKNRTITGEVIRRLLDSEVEVTRALASNHSLPDQERLALLFHPDEVTSVDAVTQADWGSVVREASRHPNPAVRAAVAMKPGRSASRLRPQLAQDASPLVRRSLCTYLMKRVSSYDGCFIRKSLDLLSRDPLAKIRAATVRDWRLSRESVERLWGDRSPRVKLQLLRFRSSGTRGDLGLLDLKNAGVRAEAAQLILANSHYSAEQHCTAMGIRIASDTSLKVRLVAAVSSRTCPVALAHLIGDEHIEIRRALVARSLPKTKGQLSSWRTCRHAAWKPKAERHKNPYYRAIAAVQPAAGKRRLRQLVQDSCWYVRAMAASNPKLEPSLLDQLAEDADPLVSECALDRIKKEQTRQQKLLGRRPR